jgi:hypothetical protein
VGDVCQAINRSSADRNTRVQEFVGDASPLTQLPLSLLCEVAESARPFVMTFELDSGEIEDSEEIDQNHGPVKAISEAMPAHSTMSSRDDHL